MKLNYELIPTNEIGKKIAQCKALLIISNKVIEVKDIDHLSQEVPLTGQEESHIIAHSKI
ncbi:MAG TPA: hypothetical protein LFW14_07255 [Rickettsia endosymbiont of Degeeriella rufa]|nr:hypothetical protein [Rickettsia endosymbiont of Degeeriella rufa]